MMGKRDDVDESCGDEEGGYLINYEQANEDGLDHSTVNGQPPASLDEDEVRSSPLEIKNQQIHANDEESVGKRVRNQLKVQKPTLKRSTRTKTAPDLFDNCAVVSVKDPMTLKYAMESFD